MLKILITNQKGGVGKSTISANLAHYFASVLNKRTTLVDFDTQSSSSKWIRAIKPQKVTVFKANLPLESSSTNRILIESRRIISSISERSEVIVADLTWFDIFNSEMFLDFDLVVLPTAVSEVELVATMEFAARHEWVFQSSYNSPSLVIVPSRVRGDQAINFKHSTERFKFSFLLTPPILDSIEAKKSFCKKFIFQSKNKKLAESFINFCESILQTSRIHFEKLSAKKKKHQKNKISSKLSSGLDYKIKKSQALQIIEKEKNYASSLEDQTESTDVVIAKDEITEIGKKLFLEKKRLDYKKNIKIEPTIEFEGEHSKRFKPVLSISRKMLVEPPKFLRKQSSAK